MATTTIGVKIDDELKERLRRAADRVDRSPHWLIKQAIYSVLDRLERGEELEGLFASTDATGDAPQAPVPNSSRMPFLEFAQSVQPQSILRAKITAAYRRPETECMPLLIAQATLPDAMVKSAADLARKLIEVLREKNAGGGVEALIHEYSLSSQEGVALMCLAEALLRIPDRATRDALIRDKIGIGDWEAHLGHSRSLFVNAATWGLLVTGRLTATTSGRKLSSALTKLIAKGGEPLIRKGVDIAMRMMGEQFVMGQTIADALANSRGNEARGFRYSYDMLGEAAMTAADAERYYRDYEQAIHAIGRSAAKRGIYEGPGISIKLSALHPRYSRGKLERVKAELLPRLKALTVLARQYDIGLNIDAEEADRLEVSLDLLEALCFDADLVGWNGIGFVVQAYQRRAPYVVEYLIDLGRRSGHRLMVRLVKGAYWDSEIKRAQVDGLEGFPVFTRKVHTDVSYLACARKLLTAPDAVYPQFATHNAMTLALVQMLAGGNYYQGQYEFQCLHGMGEALYEEVVGEHKLNRPCRIYAPVGNHKTLLAYLVRRLLENGANTSFVNQVANPDISIEALTADPVALAAAIEPIGAPHPKISAPRDLLGRRRNSLGIDLSNEQRLASLSAALLTSNEINFRAMPMLANGTIAGRGREVRNPAHLADLVGTVVEATDDVVDLALSEAAQFAAIWQATPAGERAALLMRGADLLEARMPAILGLIVREAGKSIPNAISEVREAVDFLRYYAQEVADNYSNDTHRPLGPVACISPWNFPLAIFIGQIAAALAAGNVVIAKPAEETPLTAAAAVGMLREAGLPSGALQLLPGDGTVGARLVADSRVRGVVFTGSTAVSRAIQAELVKRLNPDGTPVPFIAETGGINAMMVDSSALAEQVVADVIASAFDSAGQRCSALRLLCLQDEIADGVLEMLRGAMAELSVSPSDRLSADIGPVISAEARRSILEYISHMQRGGFSVHQCPASEAARSGFFVPPTLIEIREVGDLKSEVFGPVLHVVRYSRDAMDRVVEEVNASGYGLTFGIHSRIDETIGNACKRVNAGNIYVNRNMIGAVVGVQPFGGRGLSGTGPKAGGPLYLRRLLAITPEIQLSDGAPPALATEFCSWLEERGLASEARACRRAAERSPLGRSVELPGPVGERNYYYLHPRGVVLCMPVAAAGLYRQIAACLATGNRLYIRAKPDLLALLAELPEPIAARISVVQTDVPAGPFQAALFEGDRDALREFAAGVAQLSATICPVLTPSDGRCDENRGDYPLEWLVAEQTVSINTAAAGGNASLMSVG